MKVVMIFCLLEIVFLYSSSKSYSKIYGTTLLVTILYFTFIPSMFGSPEDRYRLPIDALLFMLVVWGVYKLVAIIATLRLKKFHNLYLTGLCFISLGAYMLDQFWPLPRGLKGAYYANLNWRGDPQFVTLDPEISRDLLKDRSKGFSKNQFSVEWNGFIKIEKSEEYTFTISSDDGSWLYINNQLVVDNGGIHGLKTAKGQIYLEAGVYPIRIRYLQVGGYYQINLSWSQDGQPLENLPTSVLSSYPINYWGYMLHRGLDYFLIFLKFMWLGTLVCFFTTYLLKMFSVYKYHFRWLKPKRSFFIYIKRGIQNILLLLGSMLIFLLIAEGIFRLTGIARVEPYWDQDWYSQYAPLNSKGFRDYEHTEEKSPGTVRILGIGDSYTFGVRVKFEDIYLTQLEKMLNESYPARHYEVINLSIPGYSTLLERDLLKTQGLRYQPDLLIIGYVLNDAEHPRIREPYNQKIKKLLGKESFYSKRLRELSHFYRYFHFLYRWGLVGRNLSKLDYLESLYSEATNPYLPLANQALAEMIQLVKQQNGKVLVVVFPFFNVDPHEEERFIKARHLIQKICDQNGAIFLDTYPYFRHILKRGKAKHYWSTPFDPHPGKEAHRIFAEQIFKTIINKNLVDL